MISLALHTWRSNLSGYLTVIAATAASGALIAGLFTIIFATESTAPRTDSEGGMDAEFLAAMSSWSVMLGAFATVFVISSTVSFVLDARSRELGLLRLVGAEPRQIKRMVRWRCWRAPRSARGSGACSPCRSPPWCGTVWHRREESNPTSPCPGGREPRWPLSESR